MDGNNRKRKLDYDEEDEEKKVEKFFALIRDAREAHKHISMNGKDKTTEKQERNKADERKKKPAVVPLWKPAFEPEDFIEVVAADKQHKRKRTHQSAIVSFPRPSSKRETPPKEEDIEEGGDRGLNLKLSL